MKCWFKGISSDLYTLSPDVDKYLYTSGDTFLKKVRKYVKNDLSRDLSTGKTLVLIDIPKVIHIIHRCVCGFIHNNYVDFICMKFVHSMPVACLTVSEGIFFVLNP